MQCDPCLSLWAGVANRTEFKIWTCSTAVSMQCILGKLICACCTSSGTDRVASLIHVCSIQGLPTAAYKTRESQSSTTDSASLTAKHSFSARRPDSEAFLVSPRQCCYISAHECLTAKRSSPIHESVAFARLTLLHWATSGVGATLRACACEPAFTCPAQKTVYLRLCLCSHEKIHLMPMARRLYA